MNSVPSHQHCLNQKATLADALWSTVQNQDVSIPTQAKYILDGGSLLHSIQWKTGSTFSSLLQAYTGYVHGKAVVVFDGYQMSSIKDMTHRRRTKGRKGPTVSFTREMKLTVAKDLFLNDATKTSLNILAKI